MLALGSIVYLKSGIKKLMIVRRGIVVNVDDQPQLFDYAGCIYPDGDEHDKLFYFNEENIDKVIFNGFSDEEDERYQSLYQQWLSDNPITKVNVEQLKKEIDTNKNETTKLQDALFNNNNN